MISIHSSPIGAVGTKDTGGMSIYIQELARELGNIGCRVDIFTRLQNRHESRIVEFAENVRVIRIPAGSEGHLQQLALYPYLKDFFREFARFVNGGRRHYDLLHNHYWLSGKVGHWVQQHWRIPQLITFHTLSVAKSLSVEEEPEPELRRATERRLVQNGHHIITTTDKERQHLIKWYGARAADISTVPCGVNIDAFKPIDKRIARRRLGLSDEESILLFVGRFMPSKGLGILLKAMALFGKRESVRLLVVGGDDPESPTSQSMLHLCRQLVIQEMVTFVGRVDHDELPNYYSAADALIVPSLYESFGLVVLEALACGTPVIATQVGAAEYKSLRDDDGLVLADPQPDSLAASIRRYVLGGYFKRLAPSTIRKPTLSFSWKAVASMILDVYVSAIREKSPPSVGNLSFNVSNL